MMARLFEELDQFRRQMDQLFERHFGALWSTAERSSEPTFSPPVETGWTDDYLNIRFVIPGVTEKDLELSIQGNQLVIRGQRRPPENFGREDATWFAIPYGRFERVVDLPSGLDLDNLQARLHDGVLDVRIPLAAEVKPKRIPIEVGEERKQIPAAA